MNQLLENNIYYLFPIQFYVYLVCLYRQKKHTLKYRIKIREIEFNRDQSSITLVWSDTEVPIRAALGYRLRRAALFFE